MELLVTTALTSSLLAFPAIAQNLPTGANVAAGSVSIAQPSATQMTITQSSASAVVNYNTFSIGAGHAVNIQQPSANAALLSRVTGNTPSTIAGSLTANGQVYLVNPNGIAITSTGTVKVGGGFVASTLGISDTDFMNGKRTFSGNGASKPVSNAGTITVGRGGYAALIGGTVENSGSIEVPLGKVGLGSGEQAALDFSGDGFLQVAAPTGSGGNDALIKQSGRIKADGGSVVITAATAREAARNAINLSGHVQARSISGRSGSIVLGGGAGGRVAVSGKLTVASRKGRGGAVTVTGRDIALAGATIDASGKTGGGTVRIGGDWQGKGNLQRAASTTIDAATTIKADATGSGNGGKVVVWSDQATRFAGTITARGGAAGGNGGDAEVSGKATLAYTGFTDLSAAKGAFGTLLLDPYNVIISNGTDTLGTGPAFTASANDSVINAATLQTALAGANVTISTGGGGGQAGDITVSAPVTWSSGATLTLDAYHSIAINAPMTIGGAGGLALVTNHGGTLTFAGGVQYTGSGGSLTINGTPYTLLYDLAGLQNINSAVLLSGNYALAKSLDATGFTGWTPLGTNGSGAVLNGGNGFTGSFTGLGNTISNLTVSKYFYAGLFGYSSGTIFDIGLLGSTVNGSFYLGGLVGYQAAGSIANAYATGTMAGYSYVGGLVGAQYGGSISQAWASGAVSGFSALGGLVGYQSGGGITLAYATGAVTGSGGFVGGLVGYQDGGNTTQAWASGAVTGSGAYVGGLVGGLQGGTIANSYFDSYSTGRANAIGVVSGVTATTVGAVTSDPAQSAAANYAYKQSAYGNLTFTATPGGNGWYMLDGQTRPFGAWEYSQNIRNSHQLQLVNMNLNASYQLARNLDLAGEFGRAGVASPTAAQSAGMWNSGFVPLGTDGAGNLRNGGNGFAGSFTGLGHTISNLTVDIGSNTYAGLFGYSIGAISDIGLIGGSIKGRLYVGGLVGEQYGGSIANAYTTGAVTGADSSIGGLVGYQAYGNITRAYATGAVTGFAIVGGLVGQHNGGLITQAYATGNVTGSDYIGGLVGYRGGGIISQAYATGAVTGQNYVGGLVGRQIGGIITTSYFDQNTTGQTSGVGSDAQTGTTALSSASGSAFVNSNYVGFDQTVWSPASAAAGATPAYYPQLYGVSGVVGVKYADAAITYGDTTPAIGTPSAVYGIGTFNTWTTAPGAGSVADVNAGTHAITAAGAAATFTPGGPSRIVNLSTLTVTPAALTITANDASKTYGQTMTFAGTEFTTSALQNGESVGAVTLSSSGASATAGVAGSPYAIAASAASGGTFNPANYAITYVDGHLTVTPAALTITANNATKTYGQTTTFAGTEFSTSALQNGESVGSVTLASSGAASTAGVAGSPYAITASAAGGGTFNPTNYAISYVDGHLTVNKAALTITANDAAKTYGQTTTFAGTEFSASGLQNGESVGSVALTSAGAAANAGVAGSPYAIAASAAGGGTFNPANYAISYIDGRLTVNRAALTITAGDAGKTYGQTQTFAGTEFTASGLQNGESVGSVALTSPGAAATAGVAGSPYAITAGSASGGTFNPANYSVSYADGHLTVTPAPLTITANAPAKIYGDLDPALTYAVSGLQNGESAGAVLSGGLVRATGEAVGSYAIGQGSLASNANYAIAYTGATFGITPAVLTITATAASKTYGNADPALTFAASGFKFADNAASTLTGGLARAGGEAVGSYAIGQGSLASNANYAIAYTGATFGITPAALTITANDMVKTLGSTLTFTGTEFTASGLRYGESVGSVTLVSLGAPAAAGLAGSPYAIAASAASGGTFNPANYTISYADGRLFVTQFARPASTPTAATVVFNSFDPIGRPDAAPPVWSSAASGGTGVFYADPHFAIPFVCFGGGYGMAQSCFSIRP